MLNISTFILLHYLRKYYLWKINIIRHSTNER